MGSPGMKAGRLVGVLWSAVLAAAFLGPGTVTTAARAGAAYGPALLWALVFSTIACLVLQEASARLTIHSGSTLGAALRARFGRGAAGWMVVFTVLGAIVLGCAAYEAGNVLGGVAGAELATGWSRTSWTVASVLAAGLLLWRGGTGVVAAVASLLVAVMGGAFVVTALRLGPSVGDLVEGLVKPSLPPGSLLLVLGLIGTTVVPYNLFLGSSLARGGDLGATRFGLAVAIGLGGLISMAVVVVGSAVEGTFDYQRLAAVLAERLGEGAGPAFGLGLFAAGFSSAVTAPLAAALTARSLFAADDPERWGDRSWRYRSVWLAVLAAGAVFGLTGVRPIPAIVAAQALNGLLLPVVAVFLWVAVNDRRLLGDAVNSAFANVIMAVVVAATLLLGLLGVARATVAAIGLPGVDGGLVVTAAALLTAVLAWPIGRLVRRARLIG